MLFFLPLQVKFQKENILSNLSDLQIITYRSWTSLRIYSPEPE